MLWLNLLKIKIPIIGFKKNLPIGEKLIILSSSTLQKLSDGFKVYYIYMNFGFIKSFINLIYLSVNFFKEKLIC